MFWLDQQHLIFSQAICHSTMLTSAIPARHECITYHFDYIFDRVIGCRSANFCWRDRSLTAILLLLRCHDYERAIKLRTMCEALENIIEFLRRAIFWTHHSNHKVATATPYRLEFTTTSYWVKRSNFVNWYTQFTRLSICPATVVNQFVHVLCLCEYPIA